MAATIKQRRIAAAVAFCQDAMSDRRFADSVQTVQAASRAFNIPVDVISEAWEAESVRVDGKTASQIANEDSWAIIEAQRAMAEGRHWMTNAIESISRDLQDLRSYVDRFDEAANGKGVNPEDVISWFVGRLSQVGQNARIDLGVNRAAAIVKTRKA